MNTFSNSTTFSDSAIPLETATGAARYWSASSNRPWVRDMSHWRGQGRWAVDDAWLSIGREHVDMVKRMVRQSGQTNAAFRRMMEWGPGGGSNAVAFARWLDTFVGVDISEANLVECGRQLAALGFDGFQPVHVPATEPAVVREHVCEPLDLFLSTAVFQHFPSQTYGRRVLQLAYDLLRPDGLALIQTRYDDGSEHVQCKTGDYNDKSAVTFTSFRVDEFWAMTQAAGFEPLYVTLKPESLYAYYSLKAVK